MPKRFSVRFLLGFVGLCAIGIVPIVWWGAYGAFLSLWVGGIVLVCYLREYAALAALIPGFCLCVLMAIILDQNEPKPLDRCPNHARQIALACLNYEVAYGHFPPAYTTDAYGRPLHSWRVLILPFMGQQELYDAIDLTKPWHHPDNLKLAEYMPSEFACPNRSTTDSPVATSYLAVVGPRTMWPPNDNRSLNDVADGASRTLLIVESQRAQIHWMAPQDPTIDEISQVDAQGNRRWLDSTHPEGFVVVYADMHTEPLSAKITDEKLRSLLTVDDGE